MKLFLTKSISNRSDTSQYVNCYHLTNENLILRAETSFWGVCLIFIPLTIINLTQLLRLSSSPLHSLKTLTASHQLHKNRDSSFHYKKQKGLVINMSTLVNSSTRINLFLYLQTCLRMRHDEVTWSRANQWDVSVIFAFRFDIAFEAKFVFYFYVLLEMHIQTE